MIEAKSARLHDHFATLTDPRRHEPIYPLINIVVIAICAVVCGADDFVAIAEFGRKKRKWLGKFWVFWVRSGCIGLRPMGFSQAWQGK